MVKQVPAAPIITAAIVVLLIAGVSGWVVHTRNAVAPQGEVADAAPPEQVGKRAPAAASNPMSGSSAESMNVQDLLAVQAANETSARALVDAGEKKLRTRYESERVDTAWAAPKQQALERLSVSPQIEQLNAQPLSIDAQCRTSVCEINADFATRLAATDWHTLYMLNAGAEMSNSSMRSTVNPDGSVHLQIYGLAKQSPQGR